MITLSPFQKDALKELINIASGKVAIVLENLSDKQIEMSVPDVGLTTFNNQNLPNFQLELVAGVQQNFTGDINGTVIFIIDFNNASQLIYSLTGQKLLSHRRLDAMSKDVLIEIGNTFLNQYLKLLHAYLNLKINFAIPRIETDHFNQILNKSMVSDQTYSLLFSHIHFQLNNLPALGHFIYLMPQSELILLLAKLDILEK